MHLDYSTGIRSEQHAALGCCTRCLLGNADMSTNWCLCLSIVSKYMHVTGTLKITVSVVLQAPGSFRIGTFMRITNYTAHHMHAISQLGARHASRGIFRPDGLNWCGIFKAFCLQYIFFVVCDGPFRCGFFRQLWLQQHETWLLFVMLHATECCVSIWVVVLLFVGYTKSAACCTTKKESRSRRKQKKRLFRFEFGVLLNMTGLSSDMLKSRHNWIIYAKKAAVLQRSRGDTSPQSRNYCTGIIPRTAWHGKTRMKAQARQVA